MFSPPPPSRSFPHLAKRSTARAAPRRWDAAGDELFEDDATPSSASVAAVRWRRSPHPFCSVAYVVDVPVNLSAGPTAAYPALPASYPKYAASAPRRCRHSTRARAALGRVQCRGAASPDVFEEARQSKTASRFPLAAPQSAYGRTPTKSFKIASTTSHETAGSLKSDPTSFVVECRALPKSSTSKVREGLVNRAILGRPRVPRDARVPASPRAQAFTSFKCRARLEDLFSLLQARPRAVVRALRRRREELLLLGLVLGLI